MQGVIKKLIIIHLGSMREPIHPNRWINSERGDDSAGGRNHRTPSVRLCGSGLHVTGKLQEARRLWAPSWGPSLYPLSSQSWGSMMVTADLRTFACFWRWGPKYMGGIEPSLLFQQARSLKLTRSSRSHGLWKPPSSFLFLFFFPFYFFPIFIMISTTSVLFFPYQEEED